MALVNEQPTMGVIRLGYWHDIPVVPQKHARLRRRLNYEDFQKIMSKEYGHEAYKLLKILIPAIDPNNPEAVAQRTAIQEWEFEGFTTEEAWKKWQETGVDDGDDEHDPSPTTDEIAIAFETALKVNGAGRLGKIMTMVNAATKVIEADQTTAMDPSRTLRGVSGESDSMNSGMTPPTPSQNAA